MLDAPALVDATLTLEQATHHSIAGLPLFEMSIGMALAVAPALGYMILTIAYLKKVMTLRKERQPCACEVACCAAHIVLAAAGILKLIV